MTRWLTLGFGTIVAFAAVAASCRSSSSGSGKGSGSSGGPADATGFAAMLPTAAPGASHVPTGRPPEVVILLDDDGTLKLVAAPSTWAGLVAGDSRKAARKLDPRMIHMLVREGRMLGTDGERLVEDLPSDADLDMVQALEDTPASRDQPRDDPPPPEDEDAGEDESGGTGTAMALDEGRIGKKDADRAEGQYKMQRPSMDRPEPPADPGAAKHGPLGRPGVFAGLGNDPHPARLAAVIGAVIRDPAQGIEPPPYAIVMPSPRAKATALIAVLDDAELIAVAHDGKVGVLRVAFPYVRDAPTTAAPPWIEVRVWPLGLEIEAVPEVASPVPWKRSAPLDAAAVAAAYKAQLDRKSLDTDHPVDVLISPETTVQQLVDVVAAIDLAGATVIGLGQVPGKDDPEAQKRGHR